MKLVTFFAACALLGAGMAAALAPGSAMPDISRQYYERQNCHQAYDLLAEALKAGDTVSAADRAWGKSYEDAGDAGKPCPQPSDTLAKRATNRVVVTDDGLRRLAQYHKQDDAAAYFEAAVSVLQGKVPGVTPNEGYGLLKKASDLGDPNAQYQLASLYIVGTFGKKDLVTALPLMESAAKAGHVDALFQTANFYKEGMGTRADARKAFDYYGQAAERGHLYAVIMAYYMAQDGEGTKKDFNVAYRLARNLADRGEAYGAVLSAAALLQQKDAVTHEDEILYWMGLALKNGDDKVRTEVGKIRPKVIAAFQRAKAPPEYHPRVRKLCPLKTVCLVNHYSGLQSCTTNVDYWHDCDG
ncbi:MAG: sel1 repeat family protein [Sphingomonas bacterium]|uniref:tetratricopeptide repeat protein n=1 Tax=Sphingomonas bacterium TaxID=1895847 RepID=UPI00262A21D7|nr:tetratricopeptide repeat protein [Sphingomonas bacterium]MDB5705455.1 sel1 repeat family protein [Sphingomonas bacterium]